ncbi:histone-fold-containing protein, partial [Obelidium mucronatum]
ALCEIQKYQKMDGRLILRAPFERLASSITFEQFGNNCGLRFAANALLCIQDASEAYSDAYRLAIHARRVTLFKEDIQLVIYLR